MSEILLYTACGIVLYIGADAALRMIERLQGEPLPYRGVIFFVLIFTMAMVLFQAIQLWQPAAA